MFFAQCNTEGEHSKKVKTRSFKAGIAHGLIIGALVGALGVFGFGLLSDMASSSYGYTAQHYSRYLDWDELDPDFDWDWYQGWWNWYQQIGGQWGYTWYWDYSRYFYWNEGYEDWARMPDVSYEQVRLRRLHGLYDMRQAYYSGERWEIFPVFRY